MPFFFFKADTSYKHTTQGSLYTYSWLDIFMPFLLRYTIHIGNGAHFLFLSEKK